MIYFEIVYDSWVEIIDDKPNYEKYKRDVWQKSKIQKRLKYRNISLEKEKAKIEEAKELREKMREDKKKRKKKGKYRKNKTKIMNKNEKPEVYDNIDPTDSLSGFVNPRGLSDSDTEIDDTYIFSV